ncbi:hypothetical protein GGI16_007309, partial [Coemansia sp. S142-1]
YRDSIKVERDKDDVSVGMRGEDSASPPANARPGSLSMSAALASLGGSVDHMDVHGGDADAANMSAYMNQPGQQNSYYG